MNIYQDLEDSLYNVINELFPEWTLVFAYTNATEPKTPYVVIDVRRLDQVGNGYTSTLVDVDPYKQRPAVTVTMQDMLAKIRFEVVGKYDETNATSDMAQRLQLALKTPRGYELQELNRLACHGQITSRRMPWKRETDMYMLYQVECAFAYTATSQDEQDYIENLGLNGIYHNTAMPPDYTMRTHLDVTYPNP